MIDCERTSDVVCPYCGTEDSYWFDYIGNRGDGDTGITTCGNCEKEIEYTVHMSIDFSTKKLPCRNGEEDHVWRARKGYDTYPNARYCAVCGMDDWFAKAPNRHGKAKKKCE
jgi:rubredoxin